MTRRLSPLSIPYRILQRGGSVAAAVAVALASGVGSIPFVGAAGPLVLFALVGALVAALVAYEVAYYRRYEYELTPDSFDIRSGVVARRNREIPLRRIQNVDISRNVVQRALGLAAVDLETAGGSETEASVRFVDYEEAKRLQREIPRLKRAAEGEAGEGGEAAGDAAAAPDRERLFELSDRELALVGALSFDARVPGILVLLLSGSIPVVSELLPAPGGAGGMGLLALGLAAVVALGLVVALVSWVAGAAVAVIEYYGFRLARVGDELQYERGLLQRYDGSIPLDKIQTLRITDTPLKRRFGYATLDIETAGYAAGQGAGGAGGSQSIVPLATRDRIDRLANEIERFGAPAFERPPKRVRRRYATRYLLVLAGLAGGLWLLDALTALTVPWYLPLAGVIVVPVAAHYKWKHRGYWLGPRHVVTRNGVFNRQTRVVPYYRIQTVIDSRSPFQRRWGIATVTVDTAGSSSLVGGDAAIVDVDAVVAADLRERLVSRLDESLAERRRGRPTGEDDGFEWNAVADDDSHSIGDDDSHSIGDDDSHSIGDDESTSTGDAESDSAGDDASDEESTTE